MTQRIKVMQVSHDLAIGGLQQVVVSLCRSIDQAKYEVSVLCLRDLGPLTEEIESLNINVRLLPQKEGKTDYLSFLKVAKIIKEEKPHILHTHNTQPLIDGTLGALLSGWRPKIIHTDHAREFPDKKRYMFAEWLVSHLVYKVVGVSDKTTQNLHTYEKIPWKKLVTIQNGIDQSKFEQPIDRKRKKKELGVPEESPIIGVISRIEKVKGISYLLQAMPRIVQEFQALKLLIVGDGSERENLQIKSRQLGIQENVFFTGIRNDVHELLQILDIYVLPSISEGLPMGLLEAMAAGCPVIASNVGGIPGVVGYEGNAILVHPGQPTEIASSVIFLLKNDQKRKNMASHLKDIFVTCYSATHMSKKYTDLYDNALNQ